MPRRQPLIRVRRSYSRDLKLRVLHQSYVLGNSSTITAINLDMDVRVVQRVKLTFKATGEVCMDWKGIGRPPLLTIEATEHMLGLLEHSPDLYLDEIQEEMWVKHAIDVSISTVCRTLKRLGMTSKKLSKAASERNEEARRAFRMEIGNEAPERLVMADESAVNLLTTYRLNGWSYKGTRARKRYSVLPAITADGIIYSHIKVGGYNGEQFLEYLEGLGVEELCEAHGIKLIYLPPYSPDYNPIEECFSFIKAYIRRHGQEFRHMVEGGDKAGPFLFLYEALNKVPASAAHGWFHNSGYI